MRLDQSNFPKKTINVTNTFSKTREFLSLSYIFNPPFFVLTSLYLLTRSERDASPRFTRCRTKEKQGWSGESGKGWFYSRVEVVVLSAATLLRTTFGRERRDKEAFFSIYTLYIRLRVPDNFFIHRVKGYLREGAISCPIRRYVVSGRVF